MKVLNDKGILTIRIHVRVDFVNGDDICKSKPFHFYIAVKKFVFGRRNFSNLYAFKNCFSFMILNSF